jgi:hypothetical protein
MKKNSFCNYVKYRTDIELAAALIESGVDIDAWMQNITDVIKNYKITESQFFNEVVPGLAGVAGAGLRGVGNSFANVGSGIVSGIRGAANAVGNAGQWAAKQAVPVMQGAKTAYAQAEISDVVKRLQGLRNILVNSQMAPPEKVDQWLQKITVTLQKASQKMNPQTQQQFNFGK